MTPVHTPDFEGGSYVQFPINFFKRKDLKWLFKKWGSDATIWLMAIMIEVRESKCKDRLIVAGHPYTRDDVDNIPCWKEIEPAFVADCIEAGLFAEDQEDKCLIILCRKQFVLYRDETAYAVAKAKQRANKAGQSQDIPETFARHSDDKTDNNKSKSKSNPIQDQSNNNPIQDQSNPIQVQGNAAEEGRDFQDGRTSTDGSERVHPGGTPPEPPSFSPLTPPTMDQAAATFSAALNDVKPGKPQAHEAEWWLELQAEAAVQAEAAEADPLDLFDAVVYAQAATVWAMKSGPDPVKQPRKYLFECAKNALFAAFDRNRDRRHSYRKGSKDPGPLAWRPPDSPRGSP